MKVRFLTLSACTLDTSDLARESQNHRMVWVETDLKDHLVQPPCHGQDTFHCHRLLIANLVAKQLSGIHWETAIPMALELQNLLLYPLFNSWTSDFVFFV